MCRPSQNYNKTARSTSKAAAFCFSIHAPLGAVTIFKGAASTAPYFRPIQSRAQKLTSGESPPLSGEAIYPKGTLTDKNLYPRRTGTFYLQIISPRRTGTFCCCKLYRFVVPVLFGVANCNGSSYQYFLVLQIASARRTGTFWCCKLKRLVIPVVYIDIFTLLNRSGSFEYVKRHINTFISDLASTDAVEDKKVM